MIAALFWFQSEAAIINLIHAVWGFDYILYQAGIKAVDMRAFKHCYLICLYAHANS